MKLSHRSKAVVKLSLWAGILAWMVFFMAMSIAAAQILSTWSIRLLGDGFQGKTMAWVTPIWAVFTALMVCWAVARFVNRRFRVK